jgi:hypothetical protein
MEPESSLPSSQELALKRRWEDKISNTELWLQIPEFNLIFISL